MAFSGKPKLTSDAPVANDGFWPTLALGDLMGKYRVPSEVDEGVIKTALVMAIVRVNEKLADAKAAMVALAHATFEDYLDDNSITQGDDELLMVLYQHAVFARTKASLLEQFVTTGTKKTQDQHDQDLMTEQHWLDESQFSIRSLIINIIPTAEPMSQADVQVALI